MDITKATICALIHFFALFVTSFSAYSRCWDLAQREFGIDKSLLMSIASIESSGNPQAYHINSDGSADVGLMQINSRHFYFLRKKGITEEMLRSDSCISVLTGALILTDMIKVYGYTWEAVGAYNAGTAPENKLLRQRYADKVRKEFYKIKFKAF